MHICNAPKFKYCFINTLSLQEPAYKCRQYIIVWYASDNSIAVAPFNLGIWGTGNMHCTGYVGAILLGLEFESCLVFTLSPSIHMLSWPSF